MPKIGTRIPEKNIKEAKPAEKDYFLFDQHNLRLLIRPTGTKTWQVPYIFNGKNNIYTVGKHGNGPNEVTSTDARRIC